MDSPPGFEVRAVTIGPGTECGYDEADWRDALVFVQRGEVELECSSGKTYRLASGDVLWLVGLPVRKLCNHRAQAALLVAVSRRRGVPAYPTGMTDEFRVVSSSNRRDHQRARKEDAQ
jgi:hypothetical protein